jgi:RimJ/RimL family protein N-acetyltransferase
MIAPRTLVVDETPLVLRPIQPEDRTELRAAFERLSEPSRYMRFHGLPHLTEAMWRYLTEVDGRRHFACVLVAPDGRIIGVARFIRAPTHVELAITVADAWQGKGLGRILLVELIARARAVGIDELVAFALADNAAIRALLVGCGAQRVETDGSLVTYRLRTGASPLAREGVVSQEPR